MISHVIERCATQPGFFFSRACVFFSGSETVTQCEGVTRQLLVSHRYGSGGEDVISRQTFDSLYRWMDMMEFVFPICSTNTSSISSTCASAQSPFPTEFFLARGPQEPPRLAMILQARPQALLPRSNALLLLVLSLEVSVAVPIRQGRDGDIRSTLRGSQ
ncbi:hypothetical protein FA95DRAFT_1187276 [Auriscalpium vulgare]|uniref:Uncharacterized protein n=1 Tax=Auriscalpium vulgare TaxID=40419 RepID=A0ACB8R3M5_9AGAM|nr:hypothetical protein FA95DRAFT_1187276 [Auriscalpium vulgare]